MRKFLLTVLVFSISYSVAAQEPVNQDLILYESQDGLVFSKKGMFEERSGAPSLVRLTDGTILSYFQWFPLHQKKSFDKIAVKISKDNGMSWTVPHLVTIRDFPSGLYRAFHPAAAVLPDGRIRLYFASERGTAQSNRGNRAVYSALSTDGIRFDFETGETFGFSETETDDPTAVFFNGQWHLYGPRAGSAGYGYHGVSPDGSFFENKAPVSASQAWEWLGNATAALGGLRFYGTSPEGVWTSLSKDGFKWKRAQATGVYGTDPAVVQAADGKFLMIAVEPR